MIVLHIDYDGVVCYEIMRDAYRINSVFCIDFFPFKMNRSYLQCVYISSRWCNECAKIPCMLAF